jgi:hypothetical protein
MLWADASYCARLTTNGYHVNAADSDALEPDRRVVRDNDPLLEVTVLSGTGGASSTAAAALRNDVVLDKTGSSATVGTVAEKQVGAATKAASDLASTGSLEELLLEGSRVLAKVGGVLSNESGHNTGGVRASHGGTGEEVDDGVACVPGAKDLLTGGIDVNALADVRESGDLVLDVHRADSDDVGVGTTKMSGSRTTSIRTIVAGSNRDVKTGLAGTLNDIVNGCSSSLKTPRHAHDRTNKPRLGLALVVVGNDPIHTLDGVRGRARSIITEDFDSNDVGALSNAELSATSSTSGMGAVTITINLGSSSGEALGGATSKNSVGCSYTSINDVDVDTGTEALVGEVVGEVLSLRAARRANFARDAFQAPWCSSLCSKGLDLSLLLNYIDLGVFSKGFGVGVANVKDQDLNRSVVGFPLDYIIVVQEFQLFEVLLNTTELSSLVALEGNDVLLGLGGVVAELGNLVVDDALSGGEDSGGESQKTRNGEGSPHVELCTGS